MYAHTPTSFYIVPYATIIRFKISFRITETLINAHVSPWIVLMWPSAVPGLFFLSTPHVLDNTTFMKTAMLQIGSLLSQ